MIPSTEGASARVLWCLRRGRTDVACVLVCTPTTVAARVLHGEEVVVVEQFPDDAAALAWARAYELRLRDKGWADSPVRKAS
jgi:hypothetical protein